MTIQEACQRLGKSESTVRRWIRSGKLKATIVEGVYDIPESAIHELVNDQAMTSQVEGTDQVLIEQLRSENEYLRKELSDTKERSDTIILQLTRQIESQQRLLEYHQEPFYKRWFRGRANRQKKGE